MAQFSKKTFSHASYATFRPSYPADLYDTVLDFHQGSKHLCVDLGSGHGVVARALSLYFSQVIGTDPSPGMIEQAKSSTLASSFSNVTFLQSSAESLPSLGEGSVDLIVAGQAAHWFDTSHLWTEMKRVLRKNGTLAFWGYKDPVLTEFPIATKVLFDYAYGNNEDSLGPYWSQPGRDIVQNKLRDLQPPAIDWDDVRRYEYEPGTKGPRTGEGTMFLSRQMSIAHCRRYVRTWSAFHAWQETHPELKSIDEGGQGDIVDKMFDDMRAAEAEWQNDGWLDKKVDLEWGSGLLMARRR